MAQTKYVMRVVLLQGKGMILESCFTFSEMDFERVRVASPFPRDYVVRLPEVEEICIARVDNECISAHEASLSVRLQFPILEFGLSF